MSLNKCQLIGRLGVDPEMKTVSETNNVTTLSVATNESWTDKEGKKQERTDWHRIVVWGKLAEICNTYLKKGSQVYVEGRIQTRSWEDDQGNKRYTTEIVGSNVQFLDSKSDDKVDVPRVSEDVGGGARTANLAPSIDTTEALPF